MLKPTTWPRTGRTFPLGGRKILFTRIGNKSGRHGALILSSADSQFSVVGIGNVGMGMEYLPTARSDVLFWVES